MLILLACKGLDTVYQKLKDFKQAGFLERATGLVLLQAAERKKSAFTGQSTCSCLGFSVNSMPARKWSSGETRASWQCLGSGNIFL